MLRNSLANSSGSQNDDVSVFSQTEHTVVAVYLIMAGMAMTVTSFSNGQRAQACRVQCSREMKIGPYFRAVEIKEENSPHLHKDRAQFYQGISRNILYVFGGISILSNLIVLGIFIKYKELRTPTNAIIINLAFTDIGVSSIGYPMSAASDLHGSWKFGYAGCQIYAGLNIFFGMASIGLLTVVAMDRYLTVCHPDIGRRMTTNTYIGMILAAWVNGLFWALMPIIGWASYAPDPTGATCTINWRKNDVSFVSFTMMVIVINFIMPLTVMFYCYYHVTQYINCHATSNCTAHLSRDWVHQVDVTKMSVIMILMFLLAWSPYSIVCLWACFGDPKKIPPSMAIIAPLFAKSSTFYNPCIYVVANRKFRRAMFDMFKCQPHQEVPVTSTFLMDMPQSPLASGRT